MIFDASGDMKPPFAVIVTFSSGVKKYATGQADTLEQFEAIVREQIPLQVPDVEDIIKIEPVKSGAP